MGALLEVGVFPEEAARLWLEKKGRDDGHRQPALPRYGPAFSPQRPQQRMGLGSQSCSHHASEGPSWLLVSLQEGIVLGALRGLAGQQTWLYGALQGNWSGVMGFLVCGTGLLSATCWGPSLCL